VQEEGTIAPGMPLSLIKLSSIDPAVCIVDSQYPPQAAQDRMQKDDNVTDDNVADGFADGSDPLFTMHNEIMGDEDEKLAKSWKQDANGILIFVSPFMAFASESNLTDL